MAVALRDAAREGDLQALRAALAAPDAELEAVDEGGFTAFLWACGRGHAECIAALAKADCDTAARSSDGTTAEDMSLALAARRGASSLPVKLSCIVTSKEEGAYGGGEGEGGGTGEGAAANG